jgi:FtsH-binding integral membrane protein
VASWEIPASAHSETVDPLARDTAQRTFMARVYQWMFAGLAITGSVAIYTASTPALFRPVAQFMFPLLIGELLLVLALSWLASRISGVVAGTLFMSMPRSMG